MYKGTKNILTFNAYAFDQNEAQCMAAGSYPSHPEVGKKYLKFWNINGLFQAHKFVAEYYKFKITP